MMIWMSNGIKVIVEYLKSKNRFNYSVKSKLKEQLFQMLHVALSYEP